MAPDLGGVDGDGLEGFFVGQAEGDRGGGLVGQIAHELVVEGTEGELHAGLVGFGGLREGAIVSIVFLFGKRQHFAEDDWNVFGLELGSGLGDVARLQDYDPDLLLFGKRDGIVDDAGAGGRNGQRHLAFQHRHHGFHFELWLETGGLDGALLAILARLVEELVDLGQLLFVGALGRGEACARGAGGCVGERVWERIAAASAERGEDQVHGSARIDGHVFPVPAIGVDECRLSGNVLALAAAEASAASTTAARGGESHDAGDSADADHAEVFAILVDGAECAQLRHELAQFARIHALTYGGDFGEPQLRGRIDHAWINPQTLAFDNARALGRDDPGADLGDLAILYNYRNAFDFRTGYRVHIHVAYDNGFGP